MAALIRAGISKRGKPAIVDENEFTYTGNASGLLTNNWRCSNRSCTATLSTRKSTGNLVGNELPVHNHSNKLLKKKAKETEVNVLSKYAGVDRVAPAAVLQEISTYLLSSNFPGQIGSASSAGAIRMKIWRQRQVINPRPKIPSSHEEYMTLQAADKYTRTADGGEFLFYKDWADSEKTVSMALFMSQWGADILRTHSVWMFDGTFQTTPKPFSQVKENTKNVFYLFNQYCTKCN